MSKSEYFPIPLVVLGVLIAVILTLIGWSATPSDENGRPLLLLADVRAVETYRRQAVAWDKELRLVDGEINAILTGNQADLFGQSRQSQNTFEHILRVSQEIDRRDAPPALTGLKDQLTQVSTAYLDAARLALQWLSISNQTNQEAVQQKLSEARSDLAVLEGSQWMEKQSP
jgi:hypothetical protein